MTEIDVMDLHAVETICPSCGSYVHRFLDGCPRCGWVRPAAYVPVIPDPPPPVPHPLPRTQSEFRRWLIQASVPADVARDRINEIAEIDDREPLAGELIAAMAINSVLGPDGHYNGAPYLAASGRFFAEKSGRIHVKKMAETIGYRYQGGVPEFPGPTDASLTYAEGNLVLRTSRGQTIAAIPPERVLFATSYVEETGSSSLMGISFGHVIYFPNHTFTGGALGVTWAFEPSALRTLMIGNRDGWATRKGEPGFYYGLVQLIGSWANMGAFARQAEIGLPPYAREIGFDAADPSPDADALPSASPQSDRAGIRMALVDLEDLRERKLINEVEYHEKRAEILARL